MKSETKSVLLAFTLLILSVVFFTGCPTPSSTNSSGGDTPNTPGSTEELYSALELPLDNSAPTAIIDGKKQTVTGDMNPLGGRIVTLGSIYEIAQIGADIPGLGPYSLFDHSGALNSGFLEKTGFTVTHSSWMDLPKKSVAADIDQDGVDNVITAVFNGDSNRISLRVQMANGTIKTEPQYIWGDGKELKSFDFMEGFGDSTWINNRFFMRDFTCGDYDGDHEMEFAVSCMTGIVIFDYDADENKFNRIGSLSLDFTGSRDDKYFPYVRIESGDLNGDGCDELVVVNGCLKISGEEDIAKLYILEGVKDSGLGVNSADLDIDKYCADKRNLSANTGDVTFASAELVLFDSNLDGCMEIALAGIKNNAGGDIESWSWYELYLRYINPLNPDSGNWQYSSTDPEGHTVPDYSLGSRDNDGGVHHRNTAVPRMAAGRFDVDKEGEMVNVMDLIMYLDGGEWTDYGNFIYDEGDNSTYSYHGMVLDTVVAGDVTGDGQDELIYMTWSDLPYGGNETNNGNNTMDSINIWGQDNDGTYGVLKTVDCDSSDAYPTLALANVDNDSLVIEYLGHEFTYSDPKVLAVLASPPYWAKLGDNMDIGNSVTSYAETESNGAGSAVNWGFNVAVSVGIAAEDPVTSSGFESEVTVNNSWDWSWGQMYTQSTTIKYSVKAGANQVIFAGVPLDSYVYRILSNDGITGKDTSIFTINIPRGISQNSLDVEAYNKIVGKDYQITENVLNHTIGEPFDYYDWDDRKTFAANASRLNQDWFFSSASATVPQGLAETEISTLKEVDSTYEFGYTLSGSQMVKAKFPVVTLGMEVGIYAGYGYTYSVGKGMEISGTVGPIADYDLWSENNFRWGMMMMPQTIGSAANETEQEFHYVTYWVDDPDVNTDE